MKATIELTYEELDAVIAALSARTAALADAIEEATYTNTIHELADRYGEAQELSARLRNLQRGLAERSEA